MEQCQKSDTRWVIRRRDRWSALAILLSTTALVWGSGCRAAPVRQIAARPHSLRDVSDLPVPAGFVLLPTESHVYDRSFRAVRLTYFRREFRDVASVVAFFKAALPHEGWKLRWEFGLDERKLVFERSGEQCEIEVDELGRHGAVRAVVTIGPVAS